MANGKPSAFWADASKRTATWTGVAAIAVVIEDWLDSAGGTNLGWEHLAMVGLAAGIRAVVALVQGKVGDPDKASFSKPATVSTSATTDTTPTD